MCGAVPPSMMVVRSGAGIQNFVKTVSKSWLSGKPWVENGPNHRRNRNFRSVLRLRVAMFNQADGETDVCRSGLGWGYLPIWQYCCDEEGIIFTGGSAFDVGELNSSTDQPCSTPHLTSARLPLPNYDCSTLVYLSAYLLKFWMLKGQNAMIFSHLNLFFLGGGAICIMQNVQRRDLTKLRKMWFFFLLQW